jgi:arginine-tRNA-protein transferase
VVIQPPTVTLEHLRLFGDYHEDMADRRGWSDKNVDAGAYHSSFVAGASEFGRELLYYDEGRLIGVALADILPDALSCVYFYHDPLLRKRALGVFSVLRQIQLAGELGLSHVYLGYWVAECQSLAYKSQYRPYELLDWNTRDAEQAVWLPHGLK